MSIADRCAFCDANVFKEQIVAEYNNWYVIATLGQITDGGHLLIFPKKHLPCMGALAFRGFKNETNTMLEITFRASRALDLEYGRNAIPCPVTIFEHGIVGQTIPHAHLHLLPVGIDLTSKVRLDFYESEFTKLEYAAQLQKRYAKNPRPYLFWNTPNGGNTVCWNPPAPPQYLRRIAARMLGRAERADWRAIDQKADERLRRETVSRLKPYF